MVILGIYQYEVMHVKVSKAIHKGIYAYSTHEIWAQGLADAY
jgi:hypothetical protein